LNVKYVMEFLLVGSFNWSLSLNVTKTWLNG